MQRPTVPFLQPNLLDRIINRAFGIFVKLGFVMSHNFLLEVPGRKSGRVYSTPVNVLEFKDKKYLVAPRGDTQWVRNVVVSKKATLVKGTKHESIGLHSIADDGKREILKAYLDRYKLTVQRYFPIPAGSPTKDFEPLVGRYPLFELTQDP
jgi:deazaflavin-dependent oxidoreductase (nitroreductase family)